MGGRILVSRWVLVGGVAFVILLASMTGLVYLQLSSQVSSLRSQVSSLQDQLYRYQLPMDVCDKMGNGDCNRVLGSFIELNPRFIQEENDTNYVYRGAGSEGSSIVNGSIVRTLSIIFEPNQVNATSDLYVVIPLSGGIAGYGGYYDLADISFLLVSRGTVPPALQVRFVESSAAASFDNITQSWSVTMEGQYDGEENVNITAVYALTANGTVNNLIWKGVSPIGGSPMSSPFSVSPYSTFVILVSVSASQGFVHGQLVEFMITDSAGHSGAWSLSLP